MGSYPALGSETDTRRMQKEEVTMNKATCYEAVVIVNPTEKEAEDGEIGHIVACLPPFLAMSADSARAKAINAASMEEKELDRVEVLLRPFA